MSTWRKTLDAVLSGKSDSNIRFEDLCNLLARLGFSVRQTGSHRIFKKGDVRLNLQPINGKAKHYQVRQVRDELQRTHEA